MENRRADIKGYRNLIKDVAPRVIQFPALSQRPIPRGMIELIGGAVAPGPMTIVAWIRG